MLAMSYRTFWIGLLSIITAGAGTRADSIWQRRDPEFAYLFYDTRARRPGDLLTIVVKETTEFEGMEKRELDKGTKTNMNFSLKGLFNAGKRVSHSFNGDFEGSNTSQRQMNGKANNTIDRKFLDHMTVTVIDILPNGNLIVEGYRRRVVAKEERTLHLRGIVRPIDIGAGNIVQSQFIANFEVRYEGKGQESSYLDNGWLGKIANIIWPF